MNDDPDQSRRTQLATEARMQGHSSFVPRVAIFPHELHNVDVRDDSKVGPHDKRVLIDGGDGLGFDVYIHLPRTLQDGVENDGELTGTKVIEYDPSDGFYMTATDFKEAIKAMFKSISAPECEDEEYEDDSYDEDDR